MKYTEIEILETEILSLDEARIVLAFNCEDKAKSANVSILATYEQDESDYYVTDWNLENITFEEQKGLDSDVCRSLSLIFDNDLSEAVSTEIYYQNYKDNGLFDSIADITNPNN